jgi:hypothetical protein
MLVMEGKKCVHEPFYKRHFIRFYPRTFPEKKLEARGFAEELEAEIEKRHSN